VKPQNNNAGISNFNVSIIPCNLIKPFELMESVESALNPLRSSLAAEKFPPSNLRASRTLPCSPLKRQY
jgi:hypothetical protein